VDCTGILFVAVKALFHSNADFVGECVAPTTLPKKIDPLSAIAGNRRLTSWLWSRAISAAV
jgi:hypothetical protein